MDNVFRTTNISYDFIKKMNNIIDNQFNKYKNQIINNILEELFEYNKLVLRRI